MSTKTVYFGYGSNLWLDQMARRCPESKYIGIGALPDWRWIINVRGYANIIPSPGDIVYGFLFELTPQDVHDLNCYEGDEYERQQRPVEYPAVKEGKEKTALECLVYVDIERLTESSPRREYIYRMNMAIADAIEKGISEDYIDKYLRKFIPRPDNKALVGED